MKRRILIALKRLLVALPLAAANVAWLPTEVLVLGTVATSPVREDASYQPFAEYLGSRLAAMGVAHGDVRIARSLDQMAGWIAGNEVDVYIDSLYPTVVQREWNRVVPLATQDRGGMKSYRSVIFVRRGSGIVMPSDLAGRSIVFRSPHSTSSYFLPKAALREQGLHLLPRREADATDRATTVVYDFSGDNESSLFWVLQGRADAGAMSREHFARLGGFGFEELMVIYETRALPRHLVSHRPGLNPAIVEAMGRILTNMHLEPQGRAVLEKLQATRRFKPIGRDDDAAIRWMQLVFRSEQNGAPGRGG